MLKLSCADSSPCEIETASLLRSELVTQQGVKVPSRGSSIAHVFESLTAKESHSTFTAEYAFFCTCSVINAYKSSLELRMLDLLGQCQGGSFLNRRKKARDNARLIRLLLRRERHAVLVCDAWKISVSGLFGHFDCTKYAVQVFLCAVVLNFAQLSVTILAAVKMLLQLALTICQKWQTHACTHAR